MLLQIENAFYYYSILTSHVEHIGRAMAVPRIVLIVSVSRDCIPQMRQRAVVMRGTWGREIDQY